jgi:hypothetical protein
MICGALPPMAIPTTIDAVYTWVDGNDPQYRSILQDYSRGSEDMNPERFRDPFQMLRYSLRSLEQNAPWIRHIYLFTRRPQVPTWLRRDHPRLRIVHHDEVMSEPRVLPTFNSNVIESYLDRLPGISDYFLYLNDDYFLGAPITPADFFTPEGRLKITGTLCGERCRRRVYERQVLSFGLLEHGPLLIERRVWRSMQDLAADDIAELREHRFRQSDDLRPDRLYRWHQLTHHRTTAVAEPFWRYLRQSAFHKIRGVPARERAAFARLQRAPRKFLCLNDDQGPRPHPEVVATVQRFLREQWPNPSTVEQTTA